jgi:ABC-2 type transport system permease protein
VTRSQTDAPARQTAAPPRTGVIAGGSLVGTATLIRLTLRRDRIRIPAWTVGVVAFLAASAGSVPELYPTAEELLARGAFVSNPVLAIFTGPGYGTEGYTVGAMVANEYLIYGVLGVALMSIFMVVRHTRAEEESGRSELVRAAVVGRHASLSAVLIVAVGVNLLIGAATAVTLSASLDELSTPGSWAFGLSMAAAGIVFAAVAGVAAQVIEHARGAIGLSLAALGVAFVLRAVGDMGDDRALSWLSPVGWVQSTRAYVDERWWPLLLPVGLALLFAVVAYVLAGRRDVGAGLVPPRPGPSRAAPWLGRPGGVALHLQRPSLIAWSLGLVVLGAVFGSLVGEVERFLADSPELAEFFGATEDGAMVEAFLGVVTALLSLLATVYAVTAVLRLRNEEGAGRAEPLLATAISRWRWAAGHLGIALGGGALIVLGAAAAVGVAAAIQRGDAALIGDMLGAGAAQVPALWFVVAVIVALYGLSSRAAPLGWVVLAYAGVVELLGETLELSDGARALSPFHHVPDLPGGDVEILPLLTLAGAAAVLLGIGWSALRRRDINVT